jgi:hypothetical protein
MAGTTMATQRMGMLMRSTPRVHMVDTASTLGTHHTASHTRTQVRKQQQVNETSNGHSQQGVSPSLHTVVGTASCSQAVQQQQQQLPDGPTAFGDGCGLAAVQAVSSYTMHQQPGPCGMATVCCHPDLTILTLVMCCLPVCHCRLCSTPGGCPARGHTTGRNRRCSAAPDHASPAATVCDT